MIKLNIKPLSINEAYKSRKYRTPKYDTFIHAVLLLLPDEIEFQDKTNIKISLEFGFSSKNSDCDNPVKTFVDCLVKKYGIDDRYIYEINIKKVIVKKQNEYIKFKIN